MTDQEIVQELRQCAKSDCSSCGMCPIFPDRECVEHLATAAASLIERLTAENAKAEAERDAALADLADARSCKNCKYACDTRDCSSCKSKTCKCRECHLDKNAWEWRGAPGHHDELNPLERAAVDRVMGPVSKGAARLQQGVQRHGDELDAFQLEAVERMLGENKEDNT